MKKKTLVLILVFFCLLLGFIVSAYGVESTTVFCYAGDSDNNMSLGSVEVFIITNGPNVCNHVFEGCNGNCDQTFS